VRLLTWPDVTGPLQFVVAGCALGNPHWHILPINVDTSVVRAEGITLREAVQEPLLGVGSGIVCSVPP
jgi:hypothetical protein